MKKFIVDGGYSGKIAWLEKKRRVWKNCEGQLHTTLQMTVLALLALLLKRF